MQAIQFPIAQHTAAPGGQVAQTAVRDDHGFEDLLRDLAESDAQPPVPVDPTPEPEGIGQADSDTGSAVDPASGLAQFVITGQAPPGLDATSDLLTLLGQDAALAMRLPPAQFAIAQAAILSWASGYATVQSAVASAGVAPLPDAATEDGAAVPAASPAPDSAASPTGVFSARATALPDAAFQPASRLDWADRNAHSNVPENQAAASVPATVHGVATLAGDTGPPAHRSGAMPPAFAFRAALPAQQPPDNALPEAPAPADSASGPASPAKSPPQASTPAGPDAPGVAVPSVLPESPVLQVSPQPGEADLAVAPPHLFAPAAGQPLAPPAAAGVMPPAFGAILSDIVSRRTDGPVELTLSPEELGRVRLSLASDGPSLHVTVQVERAETLDLLRRNADLLLAEIRAQGFAGASFTFSGWAGNQSAADRQPALISPPSPAALPADPAPSPSPAISTGGLDLLL